MMTRRSPGFACIRTSLGSSSGTILLRGGQDWIGPIGPDQLPREPTRITVKVPVDGS